MPAKLVLSVGDAGHAGDRLLGSLQRSRDADSAAVPERLVPGLREIAVNPAVIEQAKGALILRYGINPSQAISVLIRWSRVTRTRVDTIAHTLRRYAARCLAGGRVGAGASWSDDLKLVGEPISASTARAFVRDRLVEHGLAHLNDDVVLVVSELVTNAMLHTHTPFKVSLHGFEGTLLVEVEDGSPTGPVRVAAQALDNAGRGLTIVELLSSDWGVDAHSDGGKSVWAEFDLP